MGLDLVELILETEDRFDVVLPDSDCQRVRTVADLAGLVASRLPPLPPEMTAEQRARAEQRVLEGIRELTAEQAGLPLERVRPESEFVKDLGLQ